jgi:innexin
MVAAEFIDYVEKFKITRYTGMDDFADRVNSVFTVALIILCVTIITVKQYLMKAIACYIPNHPNGVDFTDYLNNYCWVHGTIPISSLDKTPQDSDWDTLDETSRITYYQWVPFVLGLQCILFYLPRMIWQIICYNRTGVDLEHIVDTASKASQTSGDDRKKQVTHIVETLEDMFFQHREYRTGRFANMRRTAYDYCACCVMSKRLGTWLVYCYFIIKILILANGVGQLYLMKRFLGFNDSMTNFGVELLNDIGRGRDWRDNMYFPRVAFCDANNVRLLGTTKNRYIAQCALPVNMLNEKIYIFLWFWTLFVCIMTAVSIPVWCFRIWIEGNRVGFIKKCIRITDTYSTDVRDQYDSLKLFIHGFLRHDGVFLMRIIFINAGDLITREIVTELWAVYKKKYFQKDFRNYQASPPVSESGKVPLPDSYYAGGNKTSEPYYTGVKGDMV